ncbi:Nickel/cobalt efflux system RcnA [Escherichia coli]|nr:Nickel/cobalt efflux system RcnA [Escherichia coli]
MVFIPSAILLGALHGLEPALQNNDGSIHHCYKGTVRQAVMLVSRQHCRTLQSYG